MSSSKKKRAAAAGGGGRRARSATTPGSLGTFTDPAGFAFASESAGGGGEMSTAAKAPRGGARGARTPSPMEADEEDDSQVERSVSGSSSVGGGTLGGSGGGGGGEGGAGVSGEMRKRLRKKLVEAVLCCNDKRRLRFMPDSKLLLREMMRIREGDFWRTMEVYRECCGAREELSRRVVQEHVRDNRDLPLPLPHTEPNFWWEVVRDEEDGQFYFYPNTQNIRYFYESSAGLLQHLYHVQGLHALLTPQLALPDFIARFRAQPLPAAQLQTLLVERRAARRRTSRMEQLAAAMHRGLEGVDEDDEDGEDEEGKEEREGEGEGEGLMQMDDTAAAVAATRRSSRIRQPSAAQYPKQVGEEDAAAASVGIAVEEGGAGGGGGGGGGSSRTGGKGKRARQRGGRSEGGAGAVGGGGGDSSLAASVKPEPLPFSASFAFTGAEGAGGAFGGGLGGGDEWDDAQTAGGKGGGGGGGGGGGRRASRRQAGAGGKAPPLPVGQEDLVMPWAEFRKLLEENNPVREPEPLAFLITSAYPWGSDGSAQLPQLQHHQQHHQQQVAGGADEDAWVFAAEGTAAAAAMGAGPLLAPPFECGTYARGRVPSFKKGRSGRLYLRRSRHVTAEGVLEVDRASIHLSPDEARLLSLERNALMLALPATQEEKGAGRGTQPSVIHVRQREGQQSWLSVRQWELSPRFGDCQVFPIRALIPEFVAKELDFLALWEGCFFSEPPSAEMVDVHRFAAFYDLPMEMIRFFFCQEFYCDKAEELVARADYVRFMRWAALYLRAGPFEFKRKMKALYHSLRAQGLSIALRDHGKELFLSQPGTYYLRYSSTSPEFLTIEVKPPPYASPMAGGHQAQASAAAAAAAAATSSGAKGSGGGSAPPATTDNFRVQVCFEEPAMAGAEAAAGGGGAGREREPLLVDEEDGRPLPRVSYWMQQHGGGGGRARARRGRSILRDIIPMIDECYRKVFAFSAMRKLQPQAVRRIYRHLDTFNLEGGLTIMPQRGNLEATVGIPLMHAAPAASAPAAPFLPTGPIPPPSLPPPPWRVFHQPPAPHRYQHQQPPLPAPPQHHSMLGSAVSAATEEGEDDDEHSGGAAVAGGWQPPLMSLAPAVPLPPPREELLQGQGRGRAADPFYDEVYQHLMARQAGGGSDEEGEGDDEEGEGDMMEEGGGGEAQRAAAVGGGGEFMGWPAGSDPWGPGGSQGSGGMGGGF